MKNALLRAGAGVLAVRIIGMTVGFTLTIALAKTLGPEGLGAYGYFTMILVLVAVPINYGWATVLLRTTARAAGNSRWSEVRGLQLLGSLISALLVLCFFVIASVYFEFFSGRFTIDTVLILVAILLFDLFSGLRLSVLRGLDHPILGQLPEMLLRPVLALAIFMGINIALKNEADVVHALLSLLIASALSMIFGSIILKMKSPNDLKLAPAKFQFMAWTTSAIILATNSGLVILNVQMDFLMLGILGSTEDLGYYRIAMQFSLLSGFVYTALNMIAAQRFAKFFSEHATRDAQKTATYLARLSFLGTLPLPILFWFFGESFMIHILSPDYIAALPAMLWLFCLQSVNGAAGFASIILVMAGQERRIVPVTMLSIALNAGLCIILIPVMGLSGAAISSFIAISVWNLILWFTALHKTKINASIFSRIQQH